MTSADSKVITTIVAAIASGPCKEYLAPIKAKADVGKTASSKESTNLKNCIKDNMSKFTKCQEKCNVYIDKMNELKDGTDDKRAKAEKMLFLKKDLLHCMTECRK